MVPRVITLYSHAFHKANNGAAGNYNIILKRHLRNEQEFLNLMNLVIHLGPLSFQRIQFV
jgi:hypothetical protein